MRVLFYNEGNLGSHILGQAQLEATLRAHAPNADGLETSFATLAPQGRVARALAMRSTRGLAMTHLDLRALRWHVVQSSRARRGLAIEVRHHRPDVLHVHSHSVALGLGGVMRRTPTALSVDVTIGDWAAMPAWRRTDPVAPVELAPVLHAERRAFERAGVVLGWTPWARRAVLTAAPRARAVVHHPGIDLRRFAPAPRRPRARARVLFVGGRFTDKGGPELVEALSPRLGHDVELDVVSPAEVPARDGLRVHRLGPEDPELMDLRAQADLLCLPSGADAAPWAVLEAMACGTPVVVSDVGGTPDLVGHGEAGVVVPHADVPALREAVFALLGDEPRRAALGRAARGRCEREYDAERQTGTLLELLRDLRVPA